jgi:peptidoglycan-N-acetylglucosamine deacetylase
MTTGGTMAGPVYLSFDDGPDPEWTPRVLDVLAAHGAAATFFLVGRRAAAHPALVRAIAAAGHAIGNHSYSHRHPWRMGEAAARREVRDGAAAIADAAGVPARWFRPPYGRRRRCMSDEAASLSETEVLWDRSAVDWGPCATRAGIARRLMRARAGEILLMHDAPAARNRPDRLVCVLPEVLQRFRTLALEPAPLVAPALP